MGGGPKAPGPSPEEQELQRLQIEQVKEQRAAMAAEQGRVAQEEQRVRERRERDLAAQSGNRVGIRSLLSNDWTGFSRGGDLGPR